jgi:hypothetical protein
MNKDRVQEAYRKREEPLDSGLIALLRWDSRR